MSRSKVLKQLLRSKETAILMEAHNGLSAKLAQEAGFPALWGSGLSISAALGVRDNNEASWTQVLEVLEFMADATDLPILLDGDTGYGNFNNVRRLVKKLEQRSVAGVCLEDKLFPKTNSFIDGEKQPLAEVDEFCGKLKAAKDTQTDPDFVVVARTEALVADWGLQEALLRATAYAESGADCILVHSAKKDAREIMAFMEHWKLETPVVIVPTKYPSEPLETFKKVGISNFIFANHALRSVITTLQRNLRKLKETESLMSIENEIAPVKEIFRLQNMEELQEVEARYLPEVKKKTRALILGASKGNFGALTADKPKLMLFVGGKPVLSWHVEAFNRQGIKDIGVVRGFKKESVDLTGPTYFDNDRHAETGELASLLSAKDYLRGETIVAYGDIMFDDHILQGLLNHEGDVVMAVDAAWKLRARDDEKRDLVSTTGVSAPLGKENCQLKAIGAGVPASEVTGEWVGLLLLRNGAAEKAAETLVSMRSKDAAGFDRADVPQLLRELMAAGLEVKVVHTFGHWRDLDAEKDLVESDLAS